VSRAIVERVEMFRSGRDRELAVTDADVEDLFCWVIARLAARRLESQRRLRSIPVQDESYAERLLIQLSRARAVADSRFADAVGVDDMAEAAAMSKYHFIRRFSDAFDITPYQYLLRVRLEHARSRLETTRDPVSAICGESGFSSLGSFSWAFKQRYGHSPSAYRRTVGASKRNYRETA
jgi:transcriptional regulator GlxA family with amidase domain